jgi:hypothetical protein
VAFIVSSQYIIISICFQAGQMVNPAPQSYFRFRLNEKREEAVYASRQRAPLGLSIF